MLRRIALLTGAIAVLLIPAGTASAVVVHTPGAGPTDCGVDSGTIKVLEPWGPAVSVDGAQADFSGCL